MPISIPTPIHRVFAFLSNIWSFILTLVRSLLTLLSFRHRSGDPLALPRVNRTRKDALARVHHHLRPILLTPRTLTLSTPSADDAPPGPGTRTPSALTLFPGVNDNPSASASGATPESSAPQRTSPKLDPNDVELGLSAAFSSASGGLNGHDHSGPGPAGTGAGVLATRTREGPGTPDKSSPIEHNTTSFSTLPLTPPDPCYLGPLPSTTDCPYAEPWPTNSTLDRSKQKLPGSPLKMSIANEPGFHHAMVQTCNPDSPYLVLADDHWSSVTVPLWTSTPRKHEKENMPPALVFGDGSKLATDQATLAGIPKAMASRMRLGIGVPSDDGSLYNPPSTNLADHNRRPKQVPIPRTKVTVSYSDMYTWRRHGARLPGKPGGAGRSQSQSQSQSQSHIELRVNRPIVEWYDTGAYLTSPVSALSPPMEEEDEDEVPLSRLLRLRARHAIGGKRVTSEGCLFFAMDTPTKVRVPKVPQGKSPKDMVLVPATAKDVFSADVATNGGVSVGVVDVV